MPTGGKGQHLPFPLAQRAHLLFSPVPAQKLVCDHGVDDTPARRHLVGRADKLVDLAGPLF